ncbi:MAG: sugar phosphate isomerase/epimerase family protein [Solirubrobacterales bacterium]
MSAAIKRPLAFAAALDFEQRSAEEVAASLLELGYDCVEWMTPHVETLVAPACAIASHQDLVTDPEGGLQRTKRAIEAAAAAEIPTVNVLTGPNLWEEGASRRYDERAWADALGALEAALAHAEPLGVTLSLEPCWGTLAQDAETARRALAEIPCAVTFDPSHFAVTGDDQPALVREWGNRIAHVHLKDAFGTRGMEGEDFHFCMLGEGSVPWPEFFDALDEVNYSGPLSVEFEAYRYYESVLDSDPVAAARLGLEQARALLERHAA